MYVCVYVRSSRRNFHESLNKIGHADLRPLCFTNIVGALDIFFFYYFLFSLRRVDRSTNKTSSRGPSVPFDLYDDRHGRIAAVVVACGLSRCRRAREILILKRSVRDSENEVKK